MATINYLTQIEVEAGALGGLAGALSTLGIDRPLIVTDKGIVAAGLLERLLGELPRAEQTALYDETPENPTEEAVLAATSLYKAQGCDGIVALGGGSSIDLAKGVRILAGHPEPLAQYAAVEGGIARITAGVAKLVAIPTTAGTGSEVGRGALISMADGRKIGFLSPKLIPNLAICDPELTLGLPAGLTAATGMDALTHCVETFLSPRENPVADAIALDGLARASGNIERAVADGGDIQARKQMMIAALEGGLTFQKGLGAVHALSHPLGALRELRLHHGTLNAVLLPAVLRFNESAVPARYAALRQAMGLAEGSDLPEAVARLNERLGLPAGLAAMGVEPALFPKIAAAALRDHCHATNAREASLEDYLSILEHSL